MGVAYTAILSVIFGVCILLLSAAVFSPLRSSMPMLGRWYPMLATMLVGMILLEAYILGFTISVEHGAAEARGRTSFPDLVQRCPPYTLPTKEGACEVDRLADTGVPGIEDRLGSYTIDPDTFTRAPDGRMIAAGLMHERAPGMLGKDPPTAANQTTIACCRANDIPYTDLSTLCPRSDLLKCSDLADERRDDDNEPVRGTGMAWTALDWIGA